MRSNPLPKRCSLEFFLVVDSLVEVIAMLEQRKLNISYWLLSEWLTIVQSLMGCEFNYWVKFIKICEFPQNIIFFSSDIKLLSFNKIYPLDFFNSSNFYWICWYIDSKIGRVVGKHFLSSTLITYLDASGCHVLAHQCTTPIHLVLSQAKR